MMLIVVLDSARQARQDRARIRSDTDTPGLRVSRTMATFSAAVQRRRRPASPLSTSTSGSSLQPGIDTGVLLSRSLGLHRVR